MNAKSFARSGVGAVPMNKTDDCSYTTTPDCTNPSPNTKLIHSHIFTTTLLSQVIMNSSVGSAVEFLGQITMFLLSRLHFHGLTSYGYLSSFMAE